MSGLGSGAALGPRLITRLQAAPKVSFVRWAFAPIRWLRLGKSRIASGGGGRGDSAGNGLSPRVRVCLHGDGPGVMIRYHHSFGSGHVRLPCHALADNRALMRHIACLGVVLQPYVSLLTFDIIAISCFLHAISQLPDNVLVSSHYYRIMDELLHLFAESFCPFY